MSYENEAAGEYAAYSDEEFGRFDDQLSHAVFFSNATFLKLTYR